MMFDLENREVDILMIGLQYLKILKIFKKHNDFTPQSIPINTFDYEFIDYNRSYTNSDVDINICAYILNTISSFIDINYIHKNDTFYEYKIMEMYNKNLLTEDQKENVFNDYVVIQIALKNKEKIQYVKEKITKIFLGKYSNDEKFLFELGFIIFDQDNTLYLLIDIGNLFLYILDPRLINFLYLLKEKGYLA